MLKECSFLSFFLSFFFFKQELWGQFLQFYNSWGKVKGIACGQLENQFIRHQANTGVFHYYSHCFTKAFLIWSFAFHFFVMVWCTCVPYIVIRITCYVGVHLSIHVQGRSGQYGSNLLLSIKFYNISQFLLFILCWRGKHSDFLYHMMLCSMAASDQESGQTSRNFWLEFRHCTLPVSGCFHLLNEGGGVLFCFPEEQEEPLDTVDCGLILIIHFIVCLFDLMN